MKRLEGHLAVYPPGSHYSRHVDQHVGSRHRLVSCILYLNPPGWREEDGGQLRMYVEHPSAAELGAGQGAGLGAGAGPAAAGGADGRVEEMGRWDGGEGAAGLPAGAGELQLQGCGEGTGQAPALRMGVTAQGEQYIDVLPLEGECGARAARCRRRCWLLLVTLLSSASGECGCGRACGRPGYTRRCTLCCAPLLVAAPVEVPAHRPDAFIAVPARCATCRWLPLHCCEALGAASPAAAVMQCRGGHNHIRRHTGGVP